MLCLRVSSLLWFRANGDSIALAPACMASLRFCPVEFVRGRLARQEWEDPSGTRASGVAFVPLILRKTPRLLEGGRVDGQSQLRRQVPLDLQLREACSVGLQEASVRFDAGPRLRCVDEP